MEFKSQFCTTAEQSRKLLELGLKPETADYRGLIPMGLAIDTTNLNIY